MEVVHENDKVFESVNAEQFDKIDSSDEDSNSGSSSSPPLNDDEFDDVESSEDDSTRKATKRTYKALKSIYKKLKRKSQGRSSSSDEESPLGNRRKRASTDDESLLGVDLEDEVDDDSLDHEKIESDDRMKRSSEEEESPIQNRRKRESVNEDSDSPRTKERKISPRKNHVEVKTSRRYSVRRKTSQSSRKLKDDDLNVREKPHTKGTYATREYQDNCRSFGDERLSEKPLGDGRTNTQRKFKVLLKTPTAKERQDWSRDFRSKFLGDFGNDRGNNKDSYGNDRDSYGNDRRDTYGYDRDTHEQKRRSFHDDIQQDKYVGIYRNNWDSYDKRRSFYDDKLQRRSRYHSEDEGRHWPSLHHSDHVRRYTRGPSEDVKRDSRGHSEDLERYYRGHREDFERYSRGHSEDLERYSRGHSEDVERYSRYRNENVERHPRRHSENRERYSKSRPHSEDVDRYSQEKFGRHSEGVEKYSTVEAGSQASWYRSQGQTQLLKIKPCSFFNNLGSCRLKSGHKSKSGATCILHICKRCYYTEKAKRYHAEKDCTQV